MATEVMAIAITTDAVVATENSPGIVTNAVFGRCGEEESESRVIIMVYVDTYAGFVTIYVDFLEIFEIIEKFQNRLMSGVSEC